MTAARDTFAATADELAAELGVTPRRIRQLAEEGRLVRLGRGRYCRAHAALAHTGRVAVPLEHGEAARDGLLDAALGWAAGPWAPGGVTEGDIEAWTKLAARWGLSRQDAVALVFEAVAALGPAAPRFRKSGGGGSGSRRAA